MKLKAIAYALMYGRNPEILKRTEGARRVKQASKRIGTLRKQLKQRDYCSNYGSSSKTIYRDGKFVATQIRSKLPSFDLSKIEERLVVQGYKICN